MHANQTSCAFASLLSSGWPYPLVCIAPSFFPDDSPAFRHFLLPISAPHRCLRSRTAAAYSQRRSGPGLNAASRDDASKIATESPSPCASPSTELLLFLASGWMACGTSRPLPFPIQRFSKDADSVAPTARPGQAGRRVCGLVIWGIWITLCSGGNGLRSHFARSPGAFLEGPLSRWWGGLS